MASSRIAIVLLAILLCLHSAIAISAKKAKSPSHRFAQARQLPPGVGANQGSSAIQRVKFNNIASSMYPGDASCVMCQFWTQRVLADVTAYLGSTSDQPILLELESKTEAQTEASTQYDERRYRSSDILPYRPREARYTGFGAPPGGWMTQYKMQETYYYKWMNEIEYNAMHEYCAMRMPASYFHDCGLFLSAWSDIVESVWYHDRPDHICQKINLCDPNSYITAAPHQVISPGALGDPAALGSVAVTPAPTAAPTPASGGGKILSALKK